MKAKLNVELTVRIEEDDLNLWELREVVRKYLVDGKYTFNSINFKTDYRDETSLASKQPVIDNECKK